MLLTYLCLLAMILRINYQSARNDNPLNDPE